MVISKEIAAYFSKGILAILLILCFALSNAHAESIDCEYEIAEKAIVSKNLNLLKEVVKASDQKDTLVSKFLRVAAYRFNYLRKNRVRTWNPENDNVPTDELGIRKEWVKGWEESIINKMFNYLLEHEDLDVNYTNKHGSTALFTAAMMAPPEIIQSLIDKGADVNHISTKGKATALNLAVRDMNLEAIKVLIKNDADVNLGKLRGKTVLEMVKYRDDPEMNQLFKSMGYLK